MKTIITAGIMALLLVSGIGIGIAMGNPAQLNNEVELTKEQIEALLGKNFTNINFKDKSWEDGRYQRCMFNGTEHITCKFFPKNDSKIMDIWQAEELGRRADIIITQNNVPTRNVIREGDTALKEKGIESL